MRHPAILAALLLSTLPPAARTVAAEPAPLPVVGGPGAYVPGEVLVKFRPGATARGRAAALALRRHALIANLYEPGWAKVGVDAGQSVTDAVAAYRDDPSVEHAQPNYVYEAFRTPDDPLYGQVWGLKNGGQTITNAYTQPPGSPLGYTANNPGTPGSDINVEKAWDVLTDCSSVVVAVVDTGVNYDQEDLASNMWSSSAYPKHGKNFTEDNDDPMDNHGHGTHVAGAIGAIGNNGKGITGVCWKASIMAVRVLDGAGRGNSSTVASGIGWAVDNGAKVINLSLGFQGPRDPLLLAAIAKALAGNVAVVVAAGNSHSDNDSSDVWPCNFDQPNLLCVAALDQQYELASFSNYGATTVAVGAPGANILGPWAGTAALAVNDDLASGWTFSTTTSGGWAYSTAVLPFQLSCLVDTGAYPNTPYNRNTDDRAYKAFTVGAVDGAVVNLQAGVDVTDGDHFRVAYRAGTPGGDPFATGGTTVIQLTGMATYPAFVPMRADVSACKGATCSVGFQLQSGSGAVTKGLAITAFEISTLTRNPTSYATINGTSMASPVVAGVAAMVRAHNPQYTAADVTSAIAASGRTVAALAGKSKTGKAVDAMGALVFIQPPTGVSATVQ